MSVFISILTVFACLFVIICIHEFGHYITVRAAGVKVLEVGFGLPPRLFAFKRGDTEYSFNLILLGAFVRPEGEQDATIPGGLAGKSPWARMGVSAAGPLANIFLAFVLISIYLMIPTDTIVGNGVMVNQVNAGEPAEDAGIQSEDIIMTVNGEEIHSSIDLRDAINSSEEGSEIEITLTRDGENISTSLIPEYNPETGRLMMGIIMSDLGVVVTQVNEGSPAEEAGIQPGDVLLTVDGKRVYDMDELTEEINSVDAGEEVTLRLQRGIEFIYINNLMPEVTSDDQLSIGVDGKWVETYIESKRHPFFQAIAKGGELLVRVPGMIVDSFTDTDEDYGEAFVGPVGVVQITGETTTEYGFSAIVWLAGILSLGVGLFNLIPIPPLDGGGILIAGVEGARRGKRLSPRAMQITYAVGAALIFTVFIMITYNDILRLIRGDNVLP